MKDRGLQMFDEIEKQHPLSDDLQELERWHAIGDIRNAFGKKALKSVLHIQTIENMDGDEMYIVPVLLTVRRTYGPKNQESYRNTVFVYMSDGDEIKLPSVKNTNMWECKGLS